MELDNQPKIPMKDWFNLRDSAGGVAAFVWILVSSLTLAFAFIGVGIFSIATGKYVGFFPMFIGLFGLSATRWHLRQYELETYEALKGWIKSTGKNVYLVFKRPLE